MSLFSDLNFLTDLTLDPRYAAVCGYTEADLDIVFAPELPGLDRAGIRAWYNWRGEERVYNPWAILHLFDSREFKAHWFETATPRFLVGALIERGQLDMAAVLGSSAFLFEFKAVGRAGAAGRPGSAGGRTAVGPALAQLKARRYADKHRAANRRVHLIGVEIDAGTRDLSAFDVEPA